MKTARPHHITFGPDIPLVRAKDFSVMSLTREQWEDVWKVVGPSVEKNMQKCVPHWMLIAAAYLEGIHHGSELAKENSILSKYREVRRA
ncbi:hypothetical protein LAV84_18565 [Rhizobium sp. VS19-DR104.2]|uniref:hypothetical protein n=1 Tax=unclassified Rhizobium TaxID=2613769 RepID=UPI001CC75876|nr:MULTISPECIES: hypothetical protein [unclassified Rhizobium]MBZ5761529.1 hypothetical protein [Rhizobium sp. VS19-DR96]MBZ5767477.1 hypothetical protein [Rhizobium sp. VS19-DR129.2]MBZ5775074.1 hypothetical protein [Rhizobium sp. VS19-DRK62.2]MBZ5785961.1 hypothetical protein [Rhizobium sp. VS19-DR121]MBZ5803387.1 hypothetical protein [Rhizobium sp. VS19-DR181]